MTNEVKALILSFVKELTDRKIAKHSDLAYVCEQLNLVAKEGKAQKCQTRIVKEE